MVAKTSTERSREYRARNGDKVRENQYGHSPEYWRTRRQEQNADRYFVAIDGEGLETPTGQVYALLAASDNTRIEHPYGITTLSALEYLINLKARHPHGIFIGFGFTYDTMMILRDLTPRHFRDLVNKGRCVYKTYHIDHVPGKWLGVRKYVNGERVRIRIYDVFGFFQMSFINAMRQLGVLQPGTPDFDMLVTMKAARGEFTVDIWNQMVEYNDLENKLLVDAMTIFRDGMRNIGLEPRSWHGAGALAERMFTRYKVKEHFIQPPAHLLPPILMAYHGGRFETPLIGEMGETYGYDINSAYPAAMSELPSLRGGAWVYNAEPLAVNVEKPQSDEITSGLDMENPFTLCFVEWRTDASYFGPFPSRNIDGSITYPKNGAGWYWLCEVDAGMRAFPGCVVIRHTWVREGVDTSSRPFSWIADLYAERKELKNAGKSAEQMAIKLGLNSLYGKCAQGVGMGDKTPTYQNYVYAGLITARTRATLLTAAMHDPVAIVSFATDGLYSRRELPITTGDSLGEWEYHRYTESFFLGSGIYYLRDGDNEPVTRARGVSGRIIDWEMLREAWKAEGTSVKYPYPVNEFIGYRNAMRLGWELFCSWQHGTKVLTVGTSKFQRIIMKIVKPRLRMGLWEKMPGKGKASYEAILAGKEMRVLPISMMFKPRENMTAEEIEDLTDRDIDGDGSFGARDSMIRNERVRIS